MVLDIGCGKRKIEEGAVGIDMSPESAADRVWNLDQYPWPLENDRFERIHISHAIEHLEDPMRAMVEVYRVARDGADVFVTTPHFSSHNSYADPSHRRHLAAASFEYFTGKDWPAFAGSACRFDIVSLELTFGGNLVLDNAGRWLARRSIRWYERHAAWIFPALDIRCHLRARKQGPEPAHGHA
jgi:SAM-dependent methyltransferase